ncbi:MAG TPA: hypothetical protein VFL97_05025 [Nitrococcus sp.]|nr:hypothetical protein [Nitrococcus sp.]
MGDQPVIFKGRPASNGCRIGSARLNAERALNALSQAMIDALRERLTSCGAT